MITLVIGGVSGSGKSTVMAELARRLEWPTLEGDDRHPPANVAKMAAGIPLTDGDRWPWLDALAAWIGEREDEGRSALVTCSGLRRSYRDRLARGHPSVRFVQLVAPVATLAARMERRRGHFMPPSLLESQRATLEPLAPDEPGVVVDARPEPAAIADEIVRRLALTAAATGRGG